MKPDLEWAVRRAAKWFLYENRCKYCGMSISANEAFCPKCKRAQR